MYGKDILRISRRKVLAGTGAALAAGPLSAALHVPEGWAQAKTLRIAAGEADGATEPWTRSQHGRSMPRISLVFERLVVLDDTLAALHPATSWRPTTRASGPSS